MTDEIREIREILEELFRTSRLPPAEIISLLQARVAKEGDTELLDVLCEIKWEYIPEKNA